MHVRLAHVSVDTIKSSAKHEVAPGLDIMPSTRADPPCVSCVKGKLARHTFPDKGSDAEEELDVAHIDSCGPFWVAAKDDSLYFLLLKDRHTRFVWIMSVAKKNDVLREFQKWLMLVERQTKKSVLSLRSNRGGEFLGHDFVTFVNGKGIVHDLTCPYTPQQNGMAEWEMRTVVESMWTMLLNMGMQHHWWHLALRQAVWVRNCLERSTTPPGTTPYQLLTGKKPDLTLARVWGCMVQFMVPDQQCGGKLAPKARWGLHLGVSPESKGWEVLDLTDNKVVTSVETHPPTDTATATNPLLAKVDEPADEDVVEVPPPPPVLAPPSPVADRLASTPVLATGDEGSLEASPVAPASGIAGGRQGAKLVDQDRKSTTGEQQTGELVKQEAAAQGQLTGEQQPGRSTGELSKSAAGNQPVDGSKQLVNEANIDEEGELSAGEESTDSDVVEVPVEKPAPELRRSGRARRPPERLSFHACLPPAAFTTVKCKAVKAAMEEEIRSLIGMGTWELVERPRGVNIMKNRWVLTTKYRIDDTVEHEKARLVVKGFTQVYGAIYDETYSPKLDKVLYMYLPDYLDNGTGRVCKLLKSLYGLKQSPLLWYRALDGVLQEAGRKKSQVDTVLYFKAGGDGVTCWVLVYVDDLLATSSSTVMLKELKELLKSSFELQEISPVVKYLGLEIVRDRPARKLWLHQQNYADKLPMTTRLDIAFACSKLGSGLMVRSDQHWREVDRCLAYLADTCNTALEFDGGTESLELISYVDADDVGDKQNRMSTGGYVFVYGGAAVSWSSSRIKCTTLHRPSRSTWRP
ncbi:unnamed protein product [Closterium sp. Yama58-4]|nr:unnamed protein product [Closterium sp. Yama58-4]